MTTEQIIEWRRIAAWLWVQRAIRRQRRQAGLFPRFAQKPTLWLLS